MPNLVTWRAQVWKNKIFFVFACKISSSSHMRYTLSSSFHARPLALSRCGQQAQMPADAGFRRCTPQRPGRLESR
eukprot:4167682-Pleurochrysis_carterae.AAC.1